MAALENLPPDQRAVLQMVLARGRSYDEIASLLAIDRGAVRQRALDAFDALTPASVLPGPERALVTDYLLGQLPEMVAEQVHSYLQAAEADREWAHAVARVVAPLASASLPEIPVGAPLGADGGQAGGLERRSDAPASEAAVPAESDEQLIANEQAVETAAVVGASVATAPAEPWAGAARSRRSGEPGGGRARAHSTQRPSSRRGGAILLGAVALMIAAAVVIAVASAGGGGNTRHQSAATTTRGSSTTTASTGTTGTGNGTPQILAQLNLTSPNGATSAVGIVQVVRSQGRVGIVIDAQGLPANTTHNAYAVWLANSATSHKFVGFVQSLVGKSGKLVTEGSLPSGAANYDHLLITLETQSKPASPGEVVLSGPFRETP